MQQNTIGQLYIISGIQGDNRDVSPNMKESISDSSIVFVEELDVFDFFCRENKVIFTGEAYEMNREFSLEDYKKVITEKLFMGKNIGIFESSGTACFMDPGYEIVDFVYRIKQNYHVPIIPIPGTSALTLAISCAGVDMTNFSFMGFLDEQSANDVRKRLHPIVYFNQAREYETLTNLLDFIKEDHKINVFIGINLGKVGVIYSNTVIRGKGDDIFKQLVTLSKDGALKEDITFVFS